MLRRLLFSVLSALILLRPAAAQRPEPGGWQQMTDTIYSTDVRNISSLRGKTFLLDLTGVGSFLTLEPARAFDVKLLTEGKLQVTIVKPAALVDDDKVFTKFRPVSYTVLGGDTAFRDGAIQGDVTCLFRLRFRQAGARELNLASLPSSYKVTWEQQGARLNIHEDTYGLVAEREAESTGTASVRLHVQNAQRNLDLTTDWLDVPICVHGTAAPQAIAADPPAQPQATPRQLAPDTLPPPVPPAGGGTTMQTGPEAYGTPAAPTPTNTIVDTPATTSIAASQCIIRAVLSSTPGAGSVTQRVSVTNRCARPVRCDGLQRTRATLVDALQTQVQTIVVPAAGNQDASAIAAPTCSFAN